MNAQFKATNPDDLIFEMNLSMTLKEWRKFRSQFEEESYASPAWDVKQAVDSMISQAERTYYPEAEK